MKPLDMLLPHCPLCRSRQLRGLHAHDRQYRECRICNLIHLIPEQRLSCAEERAHYATHENDSGDTRYRSFLSRLSTPLVERLSAGAEGLDYGSGPGPTLSIMLRELGFPTALYDPFFAPDDSALDRSYDFITCSETAEHFFQPGVELVRLNDLLRPGGWLGMMTELLDDSRPFGEWWYARDPTHVSFYGPTTMAWIASRFDWAASYPHRNVVLFQKAE